MCKRRPLALQLTNSIPEYYCGCVFIGLPLFAIHFYFLCNFESLCVFFIALYLFVVILLLFALI